MRGYYQGYAVYRKCDYVFLNVRLETAVSSESMQNNTQSSTNSMEEQAQTVALNINGKLHE